LFEADPAYHAADVSMPLWHLIQYIDDAAVDETEIARVERNLGFRKVPQNAVKHGSG
jgi:hypothetical protein